MEIIGPALAAQHSRSGPDVVVFRVPFQPRLGVGTPGCQPGAKIPGAIGRRSNQLAGDPLPLEAGFDRGVIQFDHISAEFQQDVSDHASKREASSLSLTSTMG